MLSATMLQLEADLGSLDINVRDGKTHASLKGAKVHIDRANVSSSKQVDLITDRDGNTVSIDLEEGDYTITVTHWCCELMTFNVHVTAGVSNFQIVQMKNCECRVASNETNEADVATSETANADTTSSEDLTA
jgi:hypothetical protein